MDLKTYISGIPTDQRETFARRCGTTFPHLRNVAYGKTCGETLAINIDRETDGAVPCEEMRPDVDWAYLRNTPQKAA